MKEEDFLKIRVSKEREFVPGPVEGSWVARPPRFLELHPADQKDPSKQIGTAEYRKKHTDPDGTYWGADEVYMWVTSNQCDYPDCDLYGGHFHREGEVYFGREDFEELRETHAAMRRKEIALRGGWIQEEGTAAQIRIERRRAEAAVREGQIKAITDGIFKNGKLPGQIEISAPAGEAVEVTVNNGTPVGFSEGGALVVRDLNGNHHILGGNTDGTVLPPGFTVETQTSVMGGKSITVNIQGTMETDKMGNRVMMYRPQTR